MVATSHCGIDHLNVWLLLLLSRSSVVSDLCDPIDVPTVAPQSLGFSVQEHWSGAFTHFSSA